MSLIETGKTRIHRPNADGGITAVNGVKIDWDAADYYDFDSASIFTLEFKALAPDPPSFPEPMTEQGSRFWQKSEIPGLIPVAPIKNPLCGQQAR